MKFLIRKLACNEGKEIRCRPGSNTSCIPDDCRPDSLHPKVRLRLCYVLSYVLKEFWLHSLNRHLGSNSQTGLLSWLAQPTPQRHLRMPFFQNSGYRFSPTNGQLKGHPTNRHWSVVTDGQFSCIKKNYRFSEICVSDLLFSSFRCHQVPSNAVFSHHCLSLVLLRGH